MKLNQIAKIKFWGLRNSIGASGGVVFDNDAEVTWLCRVVRVVDGLQWQIIKNKHQWGSCLIDYDQESLNNTPVDYVKIIKEPMNKYRVNGQRGKGIDKCNLSDIPF